MKKSPKISKESPEAASVEVTPVNDSHSIIGRRLSNSDSKTAEKCLSTFTSTSALSHPDSLATIVAEEYQETTSCCSEDTNSISESEANQCDDSIPSLPPKLRTGTSARVSVDCDSIISLTSTAGGTLERSIASRQGYSSDNLADVEENDYENVGYGDSNANYVEPIYDTISSPACTDSHEIDEHVDIPPALPPIPEFLLQQRLTKSKAIKSEPALNKVTETNNVQFIKPLADFWIALEKYIETGEVQNASAKKLSRPYRRSESSLNHSSLSRIDGNDPELDWSR